MYINYNTNPVGNRVGDCTVRAISKTLDEEWETTYLNMCLYGLLNHDMPSSNSVWGEYLKSKGFTRHIIDKEGRYTVEDFTNDNPEGAYILAISGHVVAVKDGKMDIIERIDQMMNEPGISHEDRMSLMRAKEQLR